MSTSTLSVQQQLDEHAAQTAAKVSDDVKQATENAGGQLETWLAKQDVLGVGDSVPDFTLPDPKGNDVQLSQLLQKGPVVLSFYRGAWCPYCNLELRGLQAALPDFK